MCKSSWGQAFFQAEGCARAWTAGYWGRFVLEGRVGKPRLSSPCDLANTTYVVVRAEGITEPVVCEKAADYRSLLGDFSSGNSGFASNPRLRPRSTVWGAGSHIQRRCINGTRQIAELQKGQVALKDTLELRKNTPPP